ncbi:MAG: hypothetical protein ACQGVC_05975 [Myxococcota bacterium]
MEASDYLLTCAEIGVALAGFAALIVAVRQRGAEPLPARDRRYVALLIERGLVATFFALLPIVLGGVGVPGQALWAGISAAFCAYAISLAQRSGTDRRAEPETFHTVVEQPVYYALLFTGWAVIALMAAHALGLGIERNAWWYAVAVTWLLTTAGYLFFFVVRSWTRAG